MKKTSSVNIVMIGTGYVGLVSGACLSEIGHRVVCVDNNREKINMLKKLKMPIYEEGLQELVEKNVKAGRLFFTTSIKEAMEFGGKMSQAVFIAVGTPPREDGSADLSAVEKVSAEVAKNMKDYTVIVEKSTVPVETCVWIEKTVKKYNRNNIPFDVCSNPEFLREGVAINDFLKPDRIVIGANTERAKDLMLEIYKPLSKYPILVCDVKSAELIKHASNSFLSTKISFINAVANLCEKTGADVELVAKGMGLDKRIGPHFLKAGIGFGGFCFPKDLEAFYWLSKKVGYSFDLLKEVKKINEEQKLWMVRQVEEELWNVDGKTISILGLAFKPKTDDMRFAPSIDIINKLIEMKAKIKAYDPVAINNAKKIFDSKIYYAKDIYDCVRGADCICLLTEWDEFKNIDFVKVKKLVNHPVLIDGRNLYNPQKIRALGFSYKSVGRK
ncbi:MAG: UDP-glucose/GDP-mannose dehydrogenase family protein [Elusimicrobiales bacterium]|nr:UDP-glucose/GDP-mannose dehydrogenase family protein [Elusimicrobiales bacterium]